MFARRAEISGDLKESKKGSMLPGDSSVRIIEAAKFREEVVVQFAGKAKRRQVNQHANQFFPPYRLFSNCTITGKIIFYK